MIRIAVVESEKETREYIEKVIDAEPGLEVVGTGTSGAEAVELASELRPDVLMLDFSNPDTDGESVTRTILEDGAQPPAILAMTSPANDDLALGAIRSGVSGICTPADPPDALVRAVRTVAAGDAVVSPSLLRRVFRRLVPDRIPLRSCSAREVEVLALTAHGATNPEIAEQLVISETTVRMHVQNLRLKLGARNRVDLVVLAHKAGVAEPGATEQRKALARELVAQEHNLAAILADRMRSDERQVGTAEGADDGERSQQIGERAHAEALEQQTRAHIEEVESAVGRVDDGSYGICARCGRPIDPARLEALPEVRLCSPCKSRPPSPLSRWR